MYNNTKKHNNSNSNQLGTTRNLTDKFMKYRSHARSGKLGLSPKSADLQMNDLVDKGDVAVYLELTPQWMKDADEIKAGMKKLKHMIQDLKTLHGQGGLVSFSQEEEGSAQSRISQKTNLIRQHIKLLDQGIQRLGTGYQDSQTDIKIIGQVRKELAQGLLQLSNTFQREEMRCLDSRKSKNSDNSTSSQTQSEIFSEIDVFQQQIFIQKEMEAQVDMIEQRDAEITNAVETIAELSQIMKDLAVMVQEQGTVMDRIDYYIEQVAASVEGGVEQLIKAEEKQKGSQMTWCIICLAIAVTIMIVVLIGVKFN